MTRGEIYFADLAPVVGREADKRRPCLIVSNDAANRAASTVTVLPITSHVQRVYPFEVLLEAELERPSKVQANQVRTISKLRIGGEAVARLDPEALERVDDALRLHLDL